MVIKGQLSATEQMKKFDDIQESHMVCLWECVGGGGGGVNVYTLHALTWKGILTHTCTVSCILNCLTLHYSCSQCKYSLLLCCRRTLLGWRRSYRQSGCVHDILIVFRTAIWLRCTCDDPQPHTQAFCPRFVFRKIRRIAREGFTCERMLA